MCVFVLLLRVGEAKIGFGSCLSTGFFFLGYQYPLFFFFCIIPDEFYLLCHVRPFLVLSVLSVPDPADTPSALPPFRSFDSAFFRDDNPSPRRDPKREVSWITHVRPDEGFHPTHGMQVGGALVGALSWKERDIVSRGVPGFSFLGHVVALAEGAVAPEVVAALGGSVFLFMRLSTGVICWRGWDVMSCMMGQV